ncbi:SDR family NAD(P)-dependent oxidoreductase [Rickettsia endosymbiont of Oedothorax gibbosus]|uniref:SDR family NAD(P)-dependent oxidoreductase n=1 Tax=Rickettsia endosymbiont of Oedothorax gibbosus TaxID=931099 RepID=UPI0020243133|nr:SDR family NAD(P)-dependent oxidoreductase [Rickettsia endosymbiont of Oedothorax gibbosus]
MRIFITIFTLIFCFSTYTIADSSSSTVLVTGSTGAFGEAICLSLASEGYNLLITGRNEKKLKSLKNKLQTKYPSTKVETLKIDFSDFKTIKAAANKTDGVSLKAVVLIGPRPSLRKNGFPSTQEWSEEFQKTFIAPLEVVRIFGEKIENNCSIVRTPSQSEGLDGYEQPKGLPLLIKILLIRQSLNYQVALDS